MSSVDIIFQIVILIFSVVIHEVAHGYAAFMLGDNTAKYEGRLTLNPLKHLDLFGSVIFPALLFFMNPGFVMGWAKPVPFNPYNLRNRRWGEAIVAFAGPFSNIMIAVVFGLLLRFGVLSSSVELLKITSLIVFTNLLLAVFNLVPIPPLDGSKILFSFLNTGFSQVRMFLERFGTLFVLFFVFFLWTFVAPIISYLFWLITGFVI